MSERVLAAADGLGPMLEQAQAVWDARAAIAGDVVGKPGWRAFEDAFPTFYQFTNRPR
ncbi:MAG TPA: multiple cyclophane-containing RiPP AmcA [Micromonosporaceae bacterium]